MKIKLLIVNSNKQVHLLEKCKSSSIRKNSSLLVKVLMKMEARNILCIVIVIFFQFHHAYMRTSRLSLSLCKVIEGIKLSYPETRTIFFAVSNVDFSPSIIEDSLTCLHQNVPLIYVDTSQAVSEARDFTIDSHVKVEGSSVAVFFLDDINPVS